MASFSGPCAQKSQGPQPALQTPAPLCPSLPLRDPAGTHRLSPLNFANSCPQAFVYAFPSAWDHPAFTVLNCPSFRFSSEVTFPGKLQGETPGWGEASVSCAFSQHRRGCAVADLGARGRAKVRTLQGEHMPCFACWYISDM